MRIKAAIGGVALALVLMGAGAPGADAKTFTIEALQLSERGLPVAPGGTIVNENFIVDGRCVQAAYAKLLNNEDPVDIAAVEPLADNQCYGSGAQLSGQLRFVAFSVYGVAVAVAEPALALTAPGPCVYDFGVLEGRFPVGTETGAYVVGEATGVRDQFASTPSCARTIRTEFTIGEYGADTFLLNTEPVALTFDAFADAPDFARPARSCASLIKRVIDAAGKTDPGADISSVRPSGCT